MKRTFLEVDTPKKEENEGINIIIFVHAPQGTLGDPSAAKKLAEAWRNQLPTLSDKKVNVQVIVLDVELEYKNKVQAVMGRDQVKIFLTSFNFNSNQFFQETKETEELENYLKEQVSHGQKVAFICVYPTPHFLNGENRNVIENWCAENKICILEMPEYNHDVVQNKITHEFPEGWPLPGAIIQTVGLGEPHKGVFLLTDEILSLKDFSNVPKEDQSAIQFMVSGTSGETLEKKWSNYLDHQGYWFGYMNKIVSPENLGNSVNFVDFILKVSKTKMIDVILPLTINNDIKEPLDPVKESLIVKDSLIMFAPPKIGADDKSHIGDTLNSFLNDDFYQRLDPMKSLMITFALPEKGDKESVLKHYFYQKKAEGWVSEEIAQEYLEEKIKEVEKYVRIINPFPLQHQTMLILMQNAQFVALSTGTQSTLEAIQNKKLPFYNLTSWSKVFFNALIDISKKACGENSALSIWLSMTKDESISIQTLADFYQKNKSVLESEIKDYIRYISDNCLIDKNICELALQLYTDKGSIKQFHFFMESFLNNIDFYMNKRNCVTPSQLAKHINSYLVQLPNDHEEIIANVLALKDKIKFDTTYQAVNLTDSTEGAFLVIPGFSTFIYQLKFKNLKDDTLIQIFSTIQKEFERVINPGAETEAKSLHVIDLLTFVENIIKTNLGIVQEKSEQAEFVFEHMMNALKQYNTLVISTKMMANNIHDIIPHQSLSKLMSDLIPFLPDGSQALMNLLRTPIDFYMVEKYGKDIGAYSFPTTNGKASLFSLLTPTAALVVIKNIKSLLENKDEMNDALREEVKVLVKDLMSSDPKYQFQIFQVIYNGQFPDFLQNIEVKTYNRWS